MISGSYYSASFVCFAIVVINAAAVYPNLIKILFLVFYLFFVSACLFSISLSKKLFSLLKKKPNGVKCFSCSLSDLQSEVISQEMAEQRGKKPEVHDS